MLVAGTIYKKSVTRKDWIIHTFDYGFFLIIKCLYMSLLSYIVERCFYIYLLSNFRLQLIHCYVYIGIKRIEHLYKDGVKMG